MAQRNLETKKTNTWLEPAIRLMNQLRFPQKFALISLLFLLPLVFVMVVLIWEINSNIDLEPGIPKENSMKKFALITN